MINLKELGVLPSADGTDFYRRLSEINGFYEERGKLTMESIVGFCIDRAKDAYILGMSEVCSFLCGKSIEEMLSIQFEGKNPTKKIPDLCDLIGWAKDTSILDDQNAKIAHEVREKRNDYGHAFLKILKGRLDKEPNRRPFSDKEALDTYEKAVKVLKYSYEHVTS